MNKKIYVKPQMEVLEDAVTMILAVSGVATPTGNPWQAARANDFESFDDVEE